MEKKAAFTHRAEKKLSPQSRPGPGLEQEAKGGSQRGTGQRWVVPMVMSFDGHRGRTCKSWCAVDRAREEDVKGWTGRQSERVGMN